MVSNVIIEQKSYFLRTQRGFDGQILREPEGYDIS